MRHLAERFFGALSPAGPAPADEEWAESHLVEGERALWRRMSGPDRRHAVRVARDTISLLGAGSETERPVIASALLHDVGKVESGLGTFARVFVTLAAIALGRKRLVMTDGSEAPMEGAGAGGGAAGMLQRVRERVSLYLTHDRIGGELLRNAGSDELTWRWAQEHHLDPSRWTVDRKVGQALKDADGD